MEITDLHYAAAESRKVPCTQCGGEHAKIGLVKDMVRFMVMDDLAIQPMTIENVKTLLNKFNVKDLGALQEKVVYLGMSEVCMSFEKFY